MHLLQQASTSRLYFKIDSQSALYKNLIELLYTLVWYNFLLPQKKVTKKARSRIQFLYFSNNCYFTRDAICHELRKIALYSICGS